ncbi:MAG: hypothetical protein ACLFS1_09180 [Opitutales bacterium]
MCLLLCPLFVVLAPAPAQARIGESRSSLETRLFNSGGVEYNDDDMVASRKKGKPYTKLDGVMPASADVRIYYKSAEGIRTKPSELSGRRVGSGWDVHVLYINGKSVMELYERSGSMSDFEMNRLLAVQSGGSFWKKVGKDDKEMPSAFGFSMIRDDEKVRAKKSGRNGLLFVNSQFDTRLKEIKEADLQEKAPVSVQGF